MFPPPSCSVKTRPNVHRVLLIWQIDTGVAPTAWQVVLKYRRVIDQPLDKDVAIFRPCPKIKFLFITMVTTWLVNG